MWLSCCFSSAATSCSTLWGPMDYRILGFPVLHYLLEVAQTHVHWVGDAIQPSHPLSPLSPPALNLSQHGGLFQWANGLDQMPKYWGFSFSTSPSSEYSGLISFRIDWLDLLEVQGTLKSLLQHHNLNVAKSFDQICHPNWDSLGNTREEINII